MVHHKESHKGDEVLLFDSDNLASSCADYYDVDGQCIESGGGIGDRDPFVRGRSIDLSYGVARAAWAAQRTWGSSGDCAWSACR